MIISKLSSYFSPSSPFSGASASFRVHSLRALLPHRFSTATDTVPPPPGTHFMADYLVNSLGFSPSEASKALKSKRLAALQSTEKPDAVVAFFKSHGFDEGHLRRIASCLARWLSGDVETTLAPKFQALRDHGIAGDNLNRVILNNPRILNVDFDGVMLPRIEFWRGLLGSADDVARAVKKNRWLLTSRVDTVMSNLSLLTERGVPDKVASLLLRRHTSIILIHPDKFLALVERAERLAVPYSSAMFSRAIEVLHCVKESRFRAKVEFMQSLGWSESQFLCAFRRMPLFFELSQETLQVKMNFFMKETGHDASYLALHPELFTYSLEKRLIPRHRAMQFLASRGAYSEDYNVLTVMVLSEKIFMERYIVPNKEKVPEIEDVYKNGASKEIAI